MEGEIKTLFMHQAGCAFFLFRVAKIVFFYQSHLWGFGIPFSGSEGQPECVYTHMSCVLIAVYISIGRAHV